MAAVDVDAWTCPRCQETVRDVDPALLAECRRSHERRHGGPPWRS